MVDGPVGAEQFDPIPGSLSPEAHYGLGVIPELPLMTTKPWADSVQNAKLEADGDVVDSALTSDAWRVEGVS